MNSASKAKQLFFLLVMVYVVCLCVGCHPKTHVLEPDIRFSATEYHIGNLPPAFAALSESEKNTPWGMEVMIGARFGREMDLYRSITAYKRAAILIDPALTERNLEIHYALAYAYYLAGKYQDAILCFEGSPLVRVPPQFPAFRELLVILYDSYKQLNEEEKAEQIRLLLCEHAPELAAKISLSHALSRGDFAAISALETTDPVQEEACQFIHEYCYCMKSPRKAQWLNAILPGAGYAYVGQKQSALTSFLINGLFIAASYQLFHEGYWAAGIMTSSLEMGWYVGGINGAGLEAKQYNQRLYDANAYRFMSRNKLFPVLVLESSF